MLRELRIENFAIVSQLSLPLGPGLNVLTGETGAGKSILLDALETLLGGRADPSLIRAGSPQATIEGVFQFPEEGPASGWAQEVRDWALERGIPWEEGTLIVQRELHLTGRGMARVNGRALPLSALRELGERLLDLQGQSEHLSLLQRRAHQDFLDRYGDLWEARRRLGEQVAALRGVRRELRQLQQSHQEQARAAELLRFQVGEIASARLSPDEERALEAERRVLAHAERLRELSASAQALLWQGLESQPSAQELLAQVVTKLREASTMDVTLQETLEQAQELLCGVEDLAQGLRHYQEEVAADPARLAAVEERLDILGRLKRKYGPSVAEVLGFQARAEAELAALEGSQDRLRALEKREAELVMEVGVAAATLSEKRRLAALALERALEGELADLHLESARFGVALEQGEDSQGLPVPGPHGLRWLAFDETGIDRVEFQITVHPGEPLAPLAKVASGGELSRLFLALRGVLSQTHPVPTLVFDEIEAGIGGRSGRIIGEKLAQIARQHQVVCVTHLPQVACYADVHLVVSKEVVGQRPEVGVRRVFDKGRERELAQMLGGATPANLLSAQEMLQHAEAWKASRKGKWHDRGSAEEAPTGTQGRFGLP